MARQLNRRRFLRGSAGVMIALPMLEAFAPRRSRAADTPIPKRLVVMYSGGSGTVYPAWQPSGVGTDFTLGPILEPLAPHQSSLVVLSGIDNESANHQAADFHSRGIVHMLTNNDLIPIPELNNGFGHRGYASGPSVDQEVAAHIGNDTRFRSLEFGVLSTSFWGAHPNSRMTYVGANEPLPAEDSPTAAFDRIFADVGADPLQLAKIRAERRSVLDFVSEDFEEVRGSLGKFDRLRLDQHLQRIREIEKGLDFEDPEDPDEPACALPTRREFPNAHDNDQYEAIGRSHTEILVTALACDLTRVASLQWSHGQSEVHHAWLGHGGSTHHGYSHNTSPDSINTLIAINRWYAEQLAYMIELMKAIPEGDGTLFDNTLILWGNEMGEGASHNYNNTPWLLAGSCGGAIQTGQHLNYGGQPHGRVLVSVLNAMGVPAQTFGKPQFSQGPLSEILA